MKQVSKSEQVIMDILWETSPMGAVEIAEQITSENWNIRTIKTLLSRLVQKGILTTRQDGRRYLYTPSLSKDDYGAAVLDNISQNFYDGRAAPLFLHLAKSKDLTTRDIDDITTALAELKAQKTKSYDD